MHRTRPPLRKWFWAIFMVANDKRGRGTSKVPETGSKEALKWVHILASNSKAFLLGTFHGIGIKHLQSYLDEFCYRFNRRRQGELFDRLVTACANSKGVTYSELTA